MRISKKPLARWLVLGVLVAGALFALTRPRSHSQGVRLLRVGYADHGDYGRAPLFCLTNGSKQSIEYAANQAGGPLLQYKVETKTGWEGPYPVREAGAFGIAGGFPTNQANVLKPGECLTFEFARPLGPRGWKMGIAYHNCRVLTAPAASPPVQTAIGVQVLPRTGRGGGAVFYSNYVYRVFGPPQPTTVVVREPSLVAKLSGALPRVTPAWLKRALQSMDRDWVAWGPEMK